MHDSQTGELLRVLTGEISIAVVIVGMSNQVYLLFTTDDTVVNSGWNITWEECE